jgi:3-deoxy-D-manno-octulosonate 8-phosphate phosphatase (KDO 8-P phosphatase)
VPAILRLTPEELAARARRLTWILLDVDGVLTDGRLYYGPDGTVTKAFDTKDGLAIELARRAGLKVGVFSGRADRATEVRAAELALDAVWTGRGDKGLAFAEFLAEHGVSGEEVAYVGDDLPDLPVLLQVGLSAAPSDAVDEVREAAAIALVCRGGRGAVRELIERILSARAD